MTFLAIDPGSEQSAFVEYGRVIIHDTPDGANDGTWFDGYGPVDFGIIDNGEMLRRLRHVDEQDFGWPDVDRIVCEWMAPRGMPTSKHEMETIYFIGRFAEASVHLPFVRLTRLTVKMHICGRTNAKDTNIRAALIDRYGGVGGKRRAVGLKASPGPLYGVSKDVWAALALAVTFSEQS